MNWILCPLRNNLPFIRAALPTFLKQDIPDLRVFLWDNASTDGTQQWAQTLTDWRIHYVHCAAPRSVAESWNSMLRYVFYYGAEYALVVNADVELRPDTYAHLLSDGGLFVTAVGTDDKNKIKPVASGDGEPFYAIPDPAKKRPHPDFSCFLIRRECWERVGPFDEGMEGAYCEDSDYHVRMHRAGIEAVCLDLPFYHVGAGTLKTADPQEVDRIQKRADKNRAYFKSKYGCEVGSKEYYALFGHRGPEEEGITYGGAFRNEGVGERIYPLVNIILISNGSRPRLLEQTLRTLSTNTPLEQYFLTLVIENRDIEFGTVLWDALRIADRTCHSILVLDPPCHIIGRLKNLGAYWSEKQFGRGEWLLFCDDDLCFFPGWLEKAAQTMQMFNHLRILGGVRHPFHGPRVGGSTRQGPTSEYLDFVETDAVAGYFHMMRWSTWDDVGPYDAHAKGTGQSEDFKICRDIVEKGGMVGYCEPAIIAHCGITSSEGKPAIGSEQIERVEGIIYE